MVLPLPGEVAGSLTPRMSTFLEDRPAGVPFRAQEYALTLGVSERTARAELARMAQMGLVRRIGVGRAGRWVRG